MAGGDPLEPLALVQGCAELRQRGNQQPGPLQGIEHLKLGIQALPVEGTGRLHHHAPLRGVAQRIESPEQGACLEDQHAVVAPPAGVVPEALTQGIEACSFAAELAL